MSKEIHDQTHTVGELTEKHDPPIINAENPANGDGGASGGVLFGFRDCKGGVLEFELEDGGAAYLFSDPYCGFEVRMPKVLRWRRLLRVTTVLGDAARFKRSHGCVVKSHLIRYADTAVVFYAVYGYGDGDKVVVAHINGECVKPLLVPYKPVLRV